MADQYTQIEDVIVPELFEPYVIEKTTEKLELMTGGAIVNDSRLNSFVAGEGVTTTFRGWNRLSGKSQVISETKELNVNKINSKSEIVTKLIRGNAWGAHTLAGALTATDPMKVIGDMMVDYWVPEEKRLILCMLKGVFASAEMKRTHTLDISGETGDKAVISGNAILDAKQLLGDNAGILAMLYMHSAVFTTLQKQKLIEYIPVPNSEIVIPTYLGYKVLVDDSAPVDSSSPKKFTTYLLAQGAIARGTGVPSTLVTMERDRNSLGDKNIVIHRRAFCHHPIGVSWKGADSITLETPEDADLENASYWEKKASDKLIGMVALTHTIEPTGVGG